MFSNAFRGNDCHIYRSAFLLRCRTCSSDCASEVTLRPHVRLPGAWAWRGNCDRPARHARSRKGICPTGAMPEVVGSVLGGAGSKPPAGEVITQPARSSSRMCSSRPFCPRSALPSSIIRSRSMGSQQEYHFHRPLSVQGPRSYEPEFKARLPTVNTLAATLSTCPTADIRANGSASFKAKQWRCS
jgi:hypothetical protein